MAETLVVNGVSFQYPDTADEEWGDDATGWAVAVTSGMLQKAGGVFALTSEVDFGSGFGVKTLYAKSRAANPASAGWARLGNTDTINWRNFANGADLPLGPDTSNNLTWNGVVIASPTGIVPVAAGGTGISSYTAGDLLYATGTTTLAKLAIGATNKVLTTTDGVSPSWNLLVNANIDAAAAIVRTKLASGTNYRILANDSSGVMSENAALTAAHVLFADANGQLAGEAQLSKTRGGTGISSTATFPSSGVVVTEAATETLSNKTFSDAVTLAEIATPSTPSSGFGKIYFKSDGFLYQLNDDGSETKVGAGSGTINYVLNPDAESNTGGWATYADAAGIAPVNGTGGSPNVTWTRVTSTPLRGVAMFRLTKDAANRQGEGVSYDFTIANADKAQPLTISFEYHPSANFSPASPTDLSDLVVYVYDITNSRLIQTVPYQLSGGSGANQKFSAQFQTDSDSTSYRLIFHIAGTGTSAWTLDVDNIVVGPQVQLYGSPITDWTAYTPSWTGSGSDPAIGNGTLVGYSRRVGGSLEVALHVTAGSTTTFGSGTYYFGLPSGLAIDTARIPSSSNTYSPLGMATVLTGGNQIPALVIYHDTITVQAFFLTGATTTYNNPFSSTSPSTFANGNFADLRFSVPIAGWGSNVTMSTDSETRVVAARMSFSTTATFASGNPDVVPFDVATYDTHGALTLGATARFTAPIYGFYHVEAQVDFAASAVGQRAVQLYKNGVFASELVNLPNGSATASNRIAGADTIELQANDYIQIFAVQISGGNLGIGNDGNEYCHVAITRQAGPAAIAASEKISFFYQQTGGQTITSGADRKVTFDSMDYDTHLAFSTSTNLFTAPAAGDYHFDFGIRINGGTAAGELQMIFYKNGSSFQECNRNHTHTGGDGFGADTTLRLNAGDTVGCYLEFTTTTSLATTATRGTYFSGFLVK